MLSVCYIGSGELVRNGGVILDTLLSHLLEILTDTDTICGLLDIINPSQ